MSPTDEADGMLPVVLSGGHGTRLWPLSRAAVPKQLCALFEESLLARTLRRLLPLGAPGLVGSAETETLTRRVLREVGIEARPALFEPRPRNTAPAVALLCRRLLQEGAGERVVGVFPADQLVADEASFLGAVRLAERCARDGHVVTLGIQPSRPETGFGYIELSDEVVASAPDGAPPLQARRVLAFREKPDAETARSYVEAGRFVWNAGMFVFRASVMAAGFERLMPELWAAMARLAPDLSNLEAIYDEIEPESLDYGIMERLGGQVSVPCSIGWSDVGSWDEVARLDQSLDRKQKPESPARVFAVDAEGNFVRPHPGRVYGLVGVDDLLVVDTADALLVARRGESQKVKELVGELRRAGRPQATEHTYEVRPWGRFEILRDTESFKSKVIEVDAGQRLSYQSHRHRSEHWVIVEGRPEVVLDGRVLALEPGEHVFIPQGARHRIRNPTDQPVVFVEVQLGTYFGEDDIERYEDDYHRI